MTKALASLCCLALVAVLSGCGRTEPRLEARWRSKGADGLRAQASAPLLRKVLSGPNADTLGARLSTNLAAVAAEWIAGGKAAPEAAGLATPILGDLLAHESAGEVWRHADGSAEVVVAVRVTSERSVVWSENFVKWAHQWHSGASGASIGAENGWLFAASRADSERVAAFRKRVLEAKSTPDRLLEFTLAVGTQPEIQAEAVATNGAVRWSGTLRVPGGAAVATPEWNHPTHLIGDSVIAFTAVRGVTGPVLGRLGLLPFLDGQQMGQMFVWSQPETPFSTYAVAHFSQPHRFMDRVHEWIRPKFSTNGAAGTHQGLVMYDLERRILALSSAPLATPTLAGPTNGQPGFVGISLVGLRRSKNPLPPALLSEIAKPGLVFYDWEMTSENIPHWSAALQVGDISSGLRPPPGEGPGRRWLEEVIPVLENSATAVTQKEPGVFEFHRKSSVGATAFELVLLTRWLDPPTPRPARGPANRPAQPAR